MKCLLNLIIFLHVFSINCLDRDNGSKKSKRQNGKNDITDSTILFEAFPNGGAFIQYHEPPQLVNQHQTAINYNYLTLPVDHFDDHNDEIWYMKCLQNSQFWIPGAPVFLYIGGNEPLVINYLVEGLMFDLASEVGGVMFAAEHRYYGESKTHEDLKYLNSEQALADYYVLLQHIKRQPAYCFSKVIVIGGGYGGSLAVWLKALYPNIIQAVVASGAPLLAKANFQKYLQQVVLDYEEYVPEKCLRKIKKIFDYYNSCLNKSDIYECLNKYSPICKFVNMNKPENQVLFLLSEISFLTASAERGIQDMRQTCDNFDFCDTERRGAPIFWKEKAKCYEYDFEEFRANLNEEEKNKDIKHWLWQCCTEFGFFQTTFAFREPYENNIPLKHYYHLCSELFADDFDDKTVGKSVRRINKMYGGLKPNVTDTIFVHGELDPWKHLGVTKNCFPKNSNNKVLVIPKASHCEDLLPRRFFDSPALINSREQVKEFVKNILFQF